MPPSVAQPGNFSDRANSEQASSSATELLRTPASSAINPRSEDARQPLSLSAEQTQLEPRTFEMSSSGNAKLSERNSFHKSVHLLTQKSVPTQTEKSQVVQVTNVRLNPTSQGLEVLLETTSGQRLSVLTSSYGETFVANIVNARLALPQGQSFRQEAPTEGITVVNVTQTGANGIRVTVVGKAGLPKAQVAQSDGNLTFSLTAPAAPTAQTPTPTPAVPESIEPESQPEPEVTAPDEEGGTQEPVEAEQPPASAPGEEEIDILVTGELEEGYRVPNATTGTRTNTPTRDIPQSIQVIPRQVLEDQQVIRLREALRNVSGVGEGNTFGNSGDQFIIRGFTQDNILRNGFRDGIVVNNFRETANLERIEVLKGPASVLYGNLEPGGIINLVTKQPLEEPFYSGELQAGSFSFFRPTIDFSGPLNSDRTLLYRLNAVYESSDYFRDFDQDIERVFIAPVLTWQISDRTDLTLEFEYLDDERPFDRGLVAIGTGIADIPFTDILGELDDVAANEEFNAAYRLEHRFSENWTLRNTFRFLSHDYAFAWANLDSLDEDTGDLSRSWTSDEGSTNSYALQTNLVGELATGSVNHTLLFGVDLFRRTFEFENRFGSAPSINIFDPVYGAAPRPEREELADVFDYEETIDTLGIYLQDQITLAENLKLLVGGRFDIVDQDSSFTGSSGEGDNQQQDEAFTPRIGIVYQPIEPLSLYASFSQSFTPNSGTTADNEILDPERGTQYEVGIKGEFFDGRLSATLAAYQITKSNIAVTDPDGRFSIAIGKQRSRGIELDVIGEITDGWNIIASYAYTDAEITEDGNSSREGNRLFGVPENAASLWTTYEIQRGDLQGLGFGLGLFFVGERQGDLDNSFQVPSYVRTDASIFYQRDNWRAAINLKNLFDVDYIQSADDRTRINPGIPFTILGSVSVEF
jgi:iron complex outermembrane receptor protein